MNLVGKIFTVLIFVMSLVFMSFAVAVYATHKNWRETVMLPKNEATSDKPAGLKHQLEDARAANKELKDQRDKMESELAQEKLAAQNNLLKLKGERDEERRKNAALVEENSSLTKQNNEKTQALSTTEGNNKDLLADNQKLRTEIREAQKIRDEKADQLIQKTDVLLQTENELNRLKQKTVQLTEQLNDAMAVIKMFNLVPVPGHYKVGVVEGIVTAVQGTGLLEISIGSDDGISKGAVLRVTRADGSMYLGKVEVVEAAPDRSVCKIIRDQQQGAIAKGDHVSSGLNDVK
jgi:vacuolar-type H+-ATPase subunit I/STV1